MAQRFLRRPSLLLVLVLATSTAAIPARAQEFPPFESFAGFSYAHVGLGPQVDLFGPASKNYYGFHLGLNFSPYRNFSVVVADLGFQSGGSRIRRLVRNSDKNVLTTQALFGPELKIRTRKANLFAHALVGVANTRLVETHSYDTIELVRRTNLALGFGGGLDINWQPRIAIRVLQADYIPTRLEGKWQSDSRVSTGIVFRFEFLPHR